MNTQVIGLCQVINSFLLIFIAVMIVKVVRKEMKIQKIVNRVETSINFIAQSNNSGNDKEE